MQYLILLQGQTAPAGGSSFLSQYSTLFLFAAMGVVVYFFMIRPQNKKAKEQKKFAEDLKKGDEVVTIGGAHGRIAEVEGDTVVLEIERGGRIRFSKSAISLESSRALKK